MMGKVNWDSKTFEPTSFEELDHGHDFYAPQSLVDAKGRRIMIAWLHTWGRSLPSHDLKHRWAGSMCLPRQLTVRHNQLYQTILPESLNALQRLKVDEEVTHAGFLEIDVSGGLDMRLGTSDDYLSFGFDDNEKIVYIDRSQLKYPLNGDESWDVSRRSVPILANKLVVVIDRNSLEIIINDGEESLSSAYYIPGDCYLKQTPPEAKA